MHLPNSNQYENKSEKNKYKLLKMNKIKQLSIILFFFTFFAGYTLAQNTQIDRIKAHIEKLASEDFAGRQPGTDGDIKSADYIVKQYNEIGLIPLAENGKQYFEFVVGSELGTENALQLGDEKMTVKTDFIPSSFTANGTLQGEVVFAGFGLNVDLEDIKWNDYKNIDVKGKWVLLLRADPELDKADSKLIEYGEDRTKCYTAKDMGAAGVLLVSGAELEKEDILPKPAKNSIASNAGVPVFFITRDVANKILANSGKKIEEIEKQLIASRTPASFNTNTVVNGKTDLVEKRAKTTNIIAKIEAKHKKAFDDEYIIIGAHYDHLGMGGAGTSSRTPDTTAVHNGADDNASGVATIIELARRLKLIDKKLKRDVVIIAFSGEELGLLGSKYYVEHPIIPLSSASLMLNFDMVGRFNKESNALVVGGVGTASGLEYFAQKSSKKNKIAVNYSKSGYGPSDHASFYGEKVPVLYFFTGTHEDYHTPFDDLEKLNIEGISTVVDYAYDIINEVVAMSTKLPYLETEDTQRGRRMNLKVTLGIVPDMAANIETGLKVSGVKKGGPAELGGIKKDDIIIAINGKEVKDIYEYMFRLQSLEKGQRINVEVVRGEAKEIVIIDL